MSQPKSLGMTGQQLQALRAKHDLSQPQLAQLARMSLTKRKGGTKSAQVVNWETGHSPIPVAMAELIRTKLYLLEMGLATFEDLIKYSLDELIRDIYS